MISTLYLNTLNIRLPVSRYLGQGAGKNVHGLHAKNLSENMETLTTSSHVQYSEAREPSSIWKRDENEQPLASAVLDVDWLITQPLMPFIVQVAPTVYYIKPYFSWVRRLIRSY